MYGYSVSHQLILQRRSSFAILDLPMCDLFHAMDILASTSSIWNLCVISIDRYLANRDPIGYRDKVSIGRTAIAIALVWITSACLAFPAILWWYVQNHIFVVSTTCFVIGVVVRRIYTRTRHDASSPTIVYMFCSRRSSRSIYR